MQKELKNTKKFKLTILFLLIVVLFLFTSCKEANPKVEILEYTSSLNQDVYDIINQDDLFYVTSVGQATDILSFQYMVLDKEYSTYNYMLDSFMDVSNIKENSVVIVFVGCSIKALSESGTTLEKEMDRARALIKAKNNQNLKIISFHIGGESRRGSTSDQFIDLMFKNSDFNVFLNRGNFDHYLSNISVSSLVPLYEMESLYQMADVMRHLCGLEGVYS